MKVVLYDRSRFHIEAVIDDPVAYDLLAALDTTDDGLALVADMIEVGARVIQRQQDGQSGELLRREVERMQETISGSQRDLLDLVGSDFAQAVSQVMTRVSEQLTSIGGRLDGALAVVDANKRVREERERGTAKGREFEEFVSGELEAIARHCGDVCHHVGDVSTGGAGRAGDVVVDIGAARGASQGRIVFEAKTGKLSRPAAMRELDRALDARSADFAVLLVDGRAKMPAGMRDLQEHGGNKMVVAVDEEWLQVYIEFAYDIARARVMSKSVEVEGVDVATAEEALEETMRKLDSAAAIKSRMTQIQNSAEECKAIVDGFVADARQGIERAMEALRP